MKLEYNKHNIPFNSTVKFQGVPLSKVVFNDAKVWEKITPFTITSELNAVLSFYQHSLATKSSYMSVASGIEGYSRISTASGSTHHSIEGLYIYLRTPDTGLARITASRTWSSSTWNLEVQISLSNVKACWKLWDSYLGFDVGYDGTVANLDVPSRKLNEKWTYAPRSIPNNPFDDLFTDAWKGGRRDANLTSASRGIVACKFFTPIPPFNYAGTSIEQGIGIQSGTIDAKFRITATIDDIGFHSDWLTTTGGTFAMYPDIS